MAQRIVRTLGDLHGQVHQRPSIADLGIYVGRSPPPAEQRITFEQWLAGTPGYWGFLSLSGTLVVLAGGARMELRGGIPAVEVARWLHSVVMPAGAVMEMRGGVPLVSIVLPGITMPGGAAFALSGGVPTVDVATWVRIVEMVAGAQFEVRAGVPTVSLVASVPGLLDFETTSLTPTGRTPDYTNENAWDGTSGIQRDSAVTRPGGGAYSMKFVAPAGPNRIRLSRLISFPASGTITFERWFRFATFAQATAFTICGLSVDKGTASWGATVYCTGTAIVIYETGGTVAVSASTWYRVVTTFSLTTNKYGFEVYAANGTLVGSRSNVTPTTNLAGKTDHYMVIGNLTHEQIAWVDDMNDGV